VTLPGRDGDGLVVPVEAGGVTDTLAVEVAFAARSCDGGRG
jgi:hypothetical protein